MTIQHITILGLHSRGLGSRVWRSHTSGSVGSCKRDCKRDCKRSRIRTSIHLARVPYHVCGSHIQAGTTPATALSMRVPHTAYVPL
jgi:hypothetical protein